VIRQSFPQEVRLQMEEAIYAGDWLVRVLESHRQSLRLTVRLEAEKFLHRVADSLENWLESLQLERTHEPNSLRANEGIESLAREICAKVAGILKAEVWGWSREELEPTLGTEITRITADVEIQARAFSALISRIRYRREGLRTPAALSKSAISDYVASVLEYSAKPSRTVCFLVSQVH
jgi:hypothetical protein